MRRRAVFVALFAALRIVFVIGLFALGAVAPEWASDDGLINLIEIALRAAGFVAWLAFLHAAASFAQGTHDGSVPAPGEVAIAYFVPFVNLVRPVQHVSALLHALRASAREAPAFGVLPALFWASWLGHTVTSVFLNGASRDPDSLAVVGWSLAYLGTTGGIGVSMILLSRAMVGSAERIVEGNETLAPEQVERVFA